MAYKFNILFVSANDPEEGAPHAAMAGMPADSRVLDFGANWGYGVWQLRQAGFSAIGYELSEPRAAYSTRLGVEIFTDWSEIQGRAPFDVVFSSHVLEHTPDPARALADNWKSCRRMACSSAFSLMARKYSGRRIQPNSIAVGARCIPSC